jgi:hypothetical protein
VANLQEAAAIFRRLAHTRPAEFTLDLAACLTDLAEFHASLNQRADALAAAEEAIGFYRQLAEIAPAVHRAHLATALHTLSRHLGMHARHPSLREAVDICRLLAEADPVTYRPRLAATLHTLAAALDGLGRTGQAALARAEAESLFHGAERAA